MTAAPASTIASALRFWCSSAAAAKGTKQAGLAGGSQLGHRGGAAARHHQVGLGEAGGHVVEEGRDLQRAGSAPVAA